MSAVQWCVIGSGIVFMMVGMFGFTRELNPAHVTIVMGGLQMVCIAVLR